MQITYPCKEYEESKHESKLSRQAIVVVVVVRSRAKCQKWEQRSLLRRAYELRREHDVSVPSNNVTSTTQSKLYDTHKIYRHRKKGSKRKTTTTTKEMQVKLISRDNCVHGKTWKERMNMERKQKKTSFQSRSVDIKYKRKPMRLFYETRSLQNQS